MAYRLPIWHRCGQDAGRTLPASCSVQERGQIPGSALRAAPGSGLSLPNVLGRDLVPQGVSVNAQSLRGPGEIPVVLVQRREHVLTFELPSGLFQGNSPCHELANQPTEHPVEGLIGQERPPVGLGPVRQNEAGPRTVAVPRACGSPRPPCVLAERELTWDSADHPRESSSGTRESSPPRCGRRLREPRALPGPPEEIPGGSGDRSCRCRREPIRLRGPGR